MRRGTLEAGQLFARDFQVERRLSEGGMGAVYVARQLSTNKLRALKLMHPQLVPDAKSRTRFVEEARIGARIASEHVVEVVAAGVDEESGAPWLAMELLDGEDLGGAVERRGPLPPADVREVFEQVGHALAAAHAQGIIHRDLKPENLFIARAHRQDAVSTIKVLDFGIAMITPASGRAVVTTAVGSPYWMAPEQARPGDTLDPSTDVWALGLIAFYLLTGSIYWRAAHATESNATAVLVEILMDPIDPPTQRATDLRARGWLPAGFDAWFARCVNRDPSARFREAGAAVRALASLLASAGPSQSVLSLAATAPSLAPDPRWSSPAYARTDAAPATSHAPAPKRAGWIGAAVVAVMLMTLAVGGGSWWLATHLSDTVATPPAPIAPSQATLALAAPPSAGDAPAVAQPIAPLPSTGASPSVLGALLPSAPSHRARPSTPPVIAPTQPAPSPTLPTPVPAPALVPVVAPTPAPVPVAPPAPTREPDPVPGSLDLSASQPCSVWVDGRAVGGTPLRTPLMPGSHVVRVRHAATGFEDTLETQIFAGQTSTLNVNVPVPTPALTPAAPVVVAVAPTPAPVAAAPAPPPPPPRAYRADGHMQHRTTFSFEEATRAQVGARCRAWKGNIIEISGGVDSVQVNGREFTPPPGRFGTPGQDFNTDQACNIVAREADPVP